MGRKLDGAVVVVVVVVVITGASSGIGRATRLAFAERGSRVLLTARRAGAWRSWHGTARRPAARLWPCPPT